MVIVLINWPNAEIRTVGVLSSEFSDSETGEKLAAVFIPRGPNVSQGAVGVVRRENVQLTDWNPHRRAHTSSSPPHWDAYGDLLSRASSIGSSCSSLS